MSQESTLKIVIEDPDFGKPSAGSSLSGQPSSAGAGSGAGSGWPGDPGGSRPGPGPYSRSDFDPRNHPGWNTPRTPTMANTPGARAEDRIASILDRVSRGLLTFDEGMDRLNRAMESNRDRLLDELRDRGVKGTFEEISTAYRKALNTAAGGGARNATVVNPHVPTAQRIDPSDKEKLAELLGSEGVESLLSGMGLKGMGRTAANFASVFAGGIGRAGSAAGVGTGAGAGAVGAGTGATGAGAGAGAAGGAAAGAASLAGPVGIALAVDYATTKMISEAGQKAREGLEGVSEATRGLMRNESLPALGRAAEGAAGFLEKTGLAGKVLGEQVRFAGDAIFQFREMVTVTVGRAKELAGYDARIAGSVASADVRKVNADLEESRRVGREYARLVDAQSRVETQLQSLLNPIKDFVTGRLADVLESIETRLKLIESVAELIKSENLISLASEGAEKAASFYDDNKETGMRLGVGLVWIIEACKLGYKLMSRSNDKNEEIDNLMMRLYNISGNEFWDPPKKPDFNDQAANRKVAGPMRQ